MPNQPVIGAGSGFVFTSSLGTPLDPDNTTKLVKRAHQTSGVRDVRMHDFPHGCVSVLMGLGVPPRIVMEIAGHSGLEMTMNVYAHVSMADKKSALDKLGDLVGQEGERLGWGQDEHRRLASPRGHYSERTKPQVIPEGAGAVKSVGRPFLLPWTRSLGAPMR